MLKITHGKGFQITFENGITVSVQWGYGNYCNNRNYYANFGDEKNNNIFECPDAEIAIWDQNDKWITKEFKNEGDDVLGYQEPADVLNALNWAANYKK